MDKDEEIVIIDNLPPGHYLELPLENDDIPKESEKIFDNLSK
jgi:hypothetical protein